MHQAKGIQTLVLAVDTAVAHELTLAPLSCSGGAPRKHYLRRSPTGEGVFVEGQVYSREVPAYHWNKKYKFGCIEEGS